MDALAHSEYWELQMHEASQVTSGLFIQLTNFQQKTFFITTVISAVAAFPGIRDQRSDASEEETVPGSCLPLVAVMKGGSNVALVVAVSKSFLNYYPGLGLELESGDLKKKK